MITSKHTRCCRWCWAYISKYAHVTAREIICSQTDYTMLEINCALADLEAGGHIALETAGAGVPRGYVALVPFVVSAPAWSCPQ